MLFLQEKVSSAPCHHRGPLHDTQELQYFTRSIAQSVGTSVTPALNLEPIAGRTYHGNIRRPRPWSELAA